MSTLPHCQHGQSCRGVLCREAEVACPLHGHPSSPTILSLWHRAVCVHAHLLTHTASSSIARAAPNPEHTLFSRLCLCLHCHGSLQGRVQTACSALSPAPCFPCDQERLRVCRSCDFKNVCLICYAWLLPTARCPVLA